MLANITRILILAAAIAFLVPASASAGDAAAGKIIFDTNCMTCHGMLGKGDGPLSPALDPKPRDFSTGVFKFDTDGDGTPGTDVDLKNVIAQGAMAFGGSPLMAPWPAFADADIENVIAYVRMLSE